MKPQADGLLVGVAGVDVKIGVVDAAVGVVDVDGLGSDVQVAGPDGRSGRVEVLAEIPPDAVEPFEFVDIFVACRCDTPAERRY